MAALLLLFPLFLLCFPLSLKSQTEGTVIPGSVLYAGNASSWASPSGEFEVGFYPISGTVLFLLAAWYARIPEKTVVWCANGDDPVHRGSKVQLYASGIILTDDKGRQIWNRSASEGSVDHAAILDVGNLVIVSNTSDVIWQSFDEPTDTILPTQTLQRYSRLTSPRSFSRGRFQLRFQGDGNLVLYPLAFLDQVYKAYWASGTVNSGQLLKFHETGSLYIELTGGGRYDVTSSEGKPVWGNYQRVSLGFDGVLRLLVHPKTNMAPANSPHSWSVVSLIPLDICSIGAQDDGSGACGFNSYCEASNNLTFTCLCPLGYVLLDLNDTSRGCVENFSPHVCSTAPAGGGDQSDRYEMVEMLNVDWPLSDYEHYDYVTEDTCSEACLNDCFCKVAIFRRGECWKKRFPLSNGRRNQEIGGKALIKVAKSKTFTSSPGV